MNAGKADAILSVITVTKEDPAGLTRTLKSVVQQDYPKMELVVVDGGESLDGSDEFREFGHWVDKWISEPDHGIFDAMNKGLALATGDWVIFMNSGDVFANGDVLRLLADAARTDRPVEEGEAPQKSSEGSYGKQNGSGGDDYPYPGRNPGRPGCVTGVIYGDSIADYGRFKVYRKAGKPEELWKGMFCNHQSMMFRREVLLDLAAGRGQHGHPACFDTTLGISADHDLVYRLYAAGHGFRHVPVAVAVWDTRGISNKRQVKSVIERYRVTGSYFDQGLKVKVYYLWLLILAGLVLGMYRLLPQNLMDTLIRIANRKSVINQPKAL